MPRENSKCRKWEKERRDRLKEGFANLAKVLPCYDPSVNICKIDVLQKAASSIQELQDRIKHLLSSDNENKTEKEVILKKLQDRVKKLLVRNEQLSNLLRDAGITVPSVCGTIKKFKKQPLWSRRISPEQAELRKNEMEKENIASTQLSKKKKPKTVGLENTAKDRLVIINGVEQKRRPRRNRKKKAPLSNCYIVLSQGASFRNNSSQQYYLITNPPNINIIRHGIKTGLGSGASKPVVMKTKPRPFRSVISPTSSLSSLGPGTIILGNGVTIPVLPQQQSVLPNSSNLILNSTYYTIPKVVQTHVPNQTDKNISSKNTVPTTTSAAMKTLPLIKPKYCLTKTTQVNKVPIPALTSPYATNYCLFNECTDLNKKKDLTKIKKPIKSTNQVNNLNKGEKKTANKRKSDVEEVAKKRAKTETEKQLPSDKVSGADTASVSSSSQILVNTPAIEESNAKINTTINTTIEVNSNHIIEKRVQEVETSEQQKDPEEGSPEIQSKNIGRKEIVSFDVSNQKHQGVVDENDKNPGVPPNEPSTITTSSSTTTATHDEIKGLEINLSHSELSNDIFASLQVPSGCQNPESTSPTAAFLLAFPLVSSGVKVTEVIDGDNSESHSVTPTLLQIGTMDATKSTQSQSDVITSNFLNLDNFSFFSSKDICGSFDNNYTTVSNNKSETPATLHCSSKSDTTNTPSIYVNVKSPCIPTCVAEPPAKQNCNIFCQKAIDSSKEMNKEIKNCQKPNGNQKFEENIYNPQVQVNSKPDLNFSLSKVGEIAQKNVDQKLQYPESTYSYSTCDFSYKPDLTKTCAAATNSYAINRNYTNPLYTNSNNYNYNYHPESNFNQNYYKNISRNESKTYYPLNYDYSDYRKNESTTLTGKYYDNSVYVKDKKNNNVARAKTENKQPINWMTTPDNRLQTSECLLNPFSKSNFSQPYPFTSHVTSTSTYFSTTTMDTGKMNCALETKKCLDLPIVSLNSHQRLEVEEKQFSWSPTKLPHFLDPPHTFVTSTLPTLVGDLALGNTLPFTEQKTDYKSVKENKDFRQINKINNYENQSNFLSVSQLVDPSKPENVSAKTTSRRNSGNRSKNNAQQKTKRVTKHDKDILPQCGINNDHLHHSRSTNNFNPFSSIDLFTEQKNKNTPKNSSNSYSAEALIGNQVPDETLNKRYPPVSNKPLGGSSFLAENIISYFPPVDLPQDNYISHNQNYQPNNFTHNLSTSFQNNTYSSNSFIYTASTIASSYLGTNNFDAGPQDYLPESMNLISNQASKDNKHYITKTCNKQLNKEEKINPYSVCPNNVKRPKKKPTSDASNTLFDFPFLPIPGSNNSPILPDDFHSHTNFLAPANPFSCKNSLYPKQNNDISGTSLLPLPPVCRSTIQHPEISPINVAGTSLTNFNLSTIFPEINKGPISDLYQDTRIKEHIHHKSYSSTTSQVPFNPEPKFNFST